jgi:DNA polymerase, archaea type
LATRFGWLRRRFPSPPTCGTTNVDHYARVLRDNFAVRLFRALTPADFAAVFADANQLSLFAPSTAAMRPVLTPRPQPPSAP